MHLRPVDASAMRQSLEAVVAGTTPARPWMPREDSDAQPAPAPAGKDQQGSSGGGGGGGGSVYEQLEQMRAQLEQELGEDVFLQAYRLTLAWQTSAVRPLVVLCERVQHVQARPAAHPGAPSSRQDNDALAALLALLPPARPGANYQQQLVALVAEDTAHFGESEPLNPGTTLPRTPDRADEPEDIPEDISPTGRRWFSAKESVLVIV